MSEPIDPSRKVTQFDREWCAQFDNSSGFLDGLWDNGVTMPKVVAHRVAIEQAAARRIFHEVDADAAISTDAAIKVYAAIKRALSDSDGPRMAETPLPAAPGEAGPARAAASGIAQKDQSHV